MTPSTKKPSTEDGLSRRDFMRRGIGAGLAATGLGAAALGLHDPTGERNRSAAANELLLPDYVVPSEGPAVAVATGADRIDTLGRALEMLGGIGRFVGRGDRVLLKVNAAYATPSALSATTHPDLVYETTRLCFAAGAERVTVVDNPINDPRSAFEVSGIGDAARRSGAHLHVPGRQEFVPHTVPGAKLLRFWPILDGPLLCADRIIGLAPVKHHHLAGASMVMKNWYGLLGGRRHLFHRDMNGIVRELAMMIRPTLVVLDGTWTMRRNGPTGGTLADLEATNTLVAGTDQVAVDVIGAGLLGLSPRDIPYLGMAARAGAGSDDLGAVRVVRDRSAT